MPTPTVCTVSGTILRPDGTAVPDEVMIKASCTQPFIHPADNSLIVNYEVSTTANTTTGAWSLNLVETETAEVSITISMFYRVGSSTITTREDYAVIIPNQASAEFADLIA